MVPQMIFSLKFLKCVSNLNVLDTVSEPELLDAELLNAELLNAELPNAELPNVELPNAENYPTSNITERRILQNG
jgi:hypothetical protein